MSALLLDLIVLVILATGFAFVISVITNYSHYDEELHKCYDEYEEKYGLEIEISNSEYQELDEETQQKYQEMFAEINSDDNVLYYYNVTINLMMLINSIGVLLAVLIGEFVVPLILKNGQTIGKKVFSIGVVKINGVKIKHLQLFVRSFLGKYAIEIMVPIMAILLIIIGHGGPFIAILLIGITLFQLILVLFNKNHQAIHDILSYSVVIF